MNTRLRLIMLAAVFAFIAPATSTMHAQFLQPNQNKYVPDGTRKCIKPKTQAPLFSGMFQPLACVTPVVNTSIRAGNESESFVVVNPTNTSNLVAFSNLASENSIFRGYSTDGGATWTRGTVATNVACCDGQAAWDTFGNLFLVYINNSVNQINVILSTDGGVTFGAPVTVGTGSVDQPSIAVGNGSVWVDWNSSGNMVARGAPVTGLGAWGPFAAQQAIPSASGSFGGIAVGPGANGGKVIVTYQSPTGGQGPATIFANVDADGLGAGGFGARITVTTTNVGGFDFIPAQSGRSIDAEAGVVWDATGGPFNNRIYLVYTEETVDENNDTDIMMRRSTDDGATWSAPVRVNDDATTRSQFLPYVALDRTTGTVAVSFHDCRNDTGVAGSGGTNNTPNDDAEYFGTFSADGGVTFVPNVRLSGGFSNAAAAGNGIDYGDYVGQTAHANKLYTAWADNANCDGTNANGTLHQFDLYENRLVLASFLVTSSVPACSGVVNTQPVDFVINLSAAVNAGTVQASDFTVNGTPANSFVLGGGNTQITFHFNTSPVTTPGIQTMHIAAGAFNDTGGNGVADFTCTFCFVAAQLAVTSTSPAVGGTFTPPAPGNYIYDVNFNQPIDPASVATSDLTLSGTAGASVTGVTVLAGNTTVRFTISSTFGGSLTASIAAGAITASGCNGNAAFTANYTIGGCPPTQYVIAPGADTIVAGVTDTGNHGDDTDTAVALPFPFKLYGNTYTSVNVNSNGRLDFVTANEPGGYNTACLPAPANVGPYDYTIFPLWEDMRSDSQSGCSGFPGGQCGVFTSVSGVAPNRIFNIEWRTVLFNNTASRQNFEARLYENSAGTNLRFDVIIGALTTTGANHNYVSGVQGATGFFTEDFCVNPAPVQNVSRTYTIPPCDQAPVPSSAVSRKTHGAAGTFDIPLPLTGSAGVECRSSGGTNDYTMVVNFMSNVTVTGSPQAQVTQGAGCVGSGGVCMGGNNVTVSGATVTIPLSNITNAQVVMVKLSGVNDGMGMGDVIIPMGVPIGDVTGNGTVTGSDVSQVKLQSGQALSGSNFRNDVNVNGTINGSDVSAVKLKSGTALP